MRTRLSAIGVLSIANQSRDRQGAPWPDLRRATVVSVAHQSHLLTDAGYGLRWQSERRDTALVSPGRQPLLASRNSRPRFKNRPWVPPHVQYANNYDDLSFDQVENRIRKTSQVVPPHIAETNCVTRRILAQCRIAFLDRLCERHA